MSHWRNKVVLIAGGSQGLGKHLARAWGQAGARVIIAARNRQRLEATAEQLRNEDNQVMTYAADLTVPEQVVEMQRWQAAEFPRLDVLVNAAGKSARGLAGETDLAQFQSLMQVNFFATVSCTQAFLPRLKESHGSVVNIGSLASKIAAPYLGGYAPSKFAAAAFTQQLRRENTDLHVLLVCPGPIAHEQQDRYADQTDGLPDSAAKPGGGARLRLLEPAALAQQIVAATTARKLELVVPRKTRVLFIAEQISAALGDWLLSKFT